MTFFLLPEISGGNVGLAITQILRLISLSQSGVRQTAELENNMTSVERILEYINLKPEEENRCKPNESLEKWPTNGSIEFIDVRLKYAEKGDTILKSLNFRINAGEKVAICGRTGTLYNCRISMLCLVRHLQHFMLYLQLEIC